MEKQSPDNTRRTARVIAFYLPQYHPTPENDRWWGKGFTEWTNVGKARPLFRGHYQPRVPADLGYYDLRVPETRQEQADMARQYGVEGFCYWHYWFGNGRRLLQRPFQEVLASGKPDFPFCLAWANHTWEDKQFSKEGTHRVLMEQLYPGDADYEAHFRALLPAFRDPRYICVDGKPLFMVYNPHELPDAPHFIGLWQRMAQAEGLPGIHFVGQTDHASEIDRLRSLGFDAVNVVRLFDFFRKDFSLPEKVYMKLMRVVFGRGRVVDYARAARFFTGDDAVVRIGANAVLDTNPQGCSLSGSVEMDGGATWRVRGPITVEGDFTVDGTANLQLPVVAAGKNYHDEGGAIPLRIEDLTEVDYDRWSTEAQVDTSFLGSHGEYRQDARLGEGQWPELRYDIVTVKVPFLYDLCKQDFIDWVARDNDQIPAQYQEEYRSVDPSPWGAEEVLQVSIGDEAVNQYLLCWPDRVVEISLTDVDLTPEVMAAVGEKLGSA